jgi:DNA repair exonuclease SbcCD nuclease subunit
LHLDKNFNISNLSRAQERKQDIDRNFAAAVEYAIKNKPDLFLVAGDVFDRTLPGNSARVFITEMMKKLKEANIRVFLIGGNHDVPRFGSQYLAIDVLRSAGLATVFSKSDILEKQVMEIDGKRVCIAGKSYYSRFETQNPLQGCSIPLDGQYNLLMLHGSLQGLNVISSIPEIAFQNPFRPSDIAPGLNYLALGHFHNHFEREHNGCSIINPGSVEKLSWAEMADEKGFVWAELHGSTVSVEFIKVQTRKIEQSEFDLSVAASSGLNLNDQIINHLRSLSDPEKIVRLDLKGQLTPEQYRQLQFNELYETARDMFFHLNIRHNELNVEGFGRVFMDRLDNPLEAFTKRLSILIAEATSEEKRMQLKQVKELGRKYLEEARR